MRLAGIVSESIVDGPGLRFTVFAQGCNMKCEGCHNPHTWDYTKGEYWKTKDVISRMLSNPLIDGLTLTGGEPFDQPVDCLELAEAAYGAGLNIWIYTGYLFEDLFEPDSMSPRWQLLSFADVIVDGPFIKEKQSCDLRWRGSTNQRVIDVQKSINASKTVLYTEKEGE